MGSGKATTERRLVCGSLSYMWRTTSNAASHSYSAQRHLRTNFAII